MNGKNTKQKERNKGKKREDQKETAPITKRSKREAYYS